MKHLLLLLLTTLYFTLQVHGQDKKVLDSLMVVYKTAKHDTTKILAVIDVAFLYINTKSDTCLTLATTALTWSEKIKFEKGKALAWGRLGNGYYVKALYPKALEYYQKSRTLCEQIKDRKGTANALNGIGRIHYAQRNTTVALEYYEKALKIMQEINNKQGIALSFNNIASIYAAQGSFAKALEYCEKSLKIREDMGDKEGIAAILNNMGALSAMHGDYLAGSNYYEKSLKIKEEIKDKWGMIYSLTGLSQIYEKQKNYDKGIEYAQRSLRIAQELKLLKETQEASQALYTNHKLKGNYAKALEYFELYKQTQDTLFNVEKAKSLASLESKYAYEKKETALKEAHEKNLAFQRNYLYLTLLGLGAFGIIIIIVLRNNRLKNRLNQQLLYSQQAIEEKNKELQIAFAEIQSFNEEITQQQEELQTLNDNLSLSNKDLAYTTKRIASSIAAAKIIQQAVLPYPSKVYDLLQICFILYRPKDVVSGDFYWLNKIGDKTILIVGDCTGHGVPGAFMTLIGCNLLDKIVRVWNITNPAEILQRLHEEVKIVLQQTETGNTNGMDMTVLQWQKIGTDMLLTFAAAKQSILYHLSETQTLNEIRGSRKSIGGEQNEQKKFETHTLTLPPNSTFYIGSDGLEDQNDKNRLRFGRDKIKQILGEAINLPLAEQKNKLETALDAHMLGTEQRDDIIFIGVKV